MSKAENSANTVILFPNFEVLKNDVEKLRTELSMLYLERDNLLYQECKNIEMAYMLAVGALEYKVFELDCQVRRLKRKAELIQAKKNRQEKVILSQIDSTLDIEFAEYQAQLDEQIEKINMALERSQLAELSDDENRELKKLYRAIVKALHPDLHPDITEAQEQLFMSAVEAYEHGDLSALRIISAMVEAPDIPDEKENSMVMLVREKERLTKLVQSINEKIDEIKSEFPYTMKSFVGSPEEINARKAELQEVIDSLKELLEAYNERIKEMLR